MRSNPERLAWAVLLLSFSTCLLLAVALPVGVRAYVFRAEVVQSVNLEVQRAPLRVTLAGRGVPVAIAENRSEIPERTTVTTDSTAGQLVTVAPGQGDQVVTRAQIYDNTEVTLQAARSPRFSASSAPHDVVLAVHTGRVRIGVLDTRERVTVVTVHTPHGEVTLSQGSYEVKVVPSRVEVTVRDGTARITNNGDEVLSLGPAERAFVADGQLVGPLPGARNLVFNGDFRLPLGPDSGWVTYDTQTDPAQPAPEISIVAEEGRNAADFVRDGSNHAEVGIVQEINYDVRDFTFLELHLATRIDYQDIAGFGGCGYLSSECPIIAVINYKDIHGTDQEWRHGFYTGEPAPEWLLYPWTEQIQTGTWQTFDSGNLMEELSDAPPALVQRLTIYASGHTFRALVTEVELLAQE
jgi:hypothetical protein